MRKNTSQIIKDVMKKWRFDKVINVMLADGTLDVHEYKTFCDAQLGLLKKGEAIIEPSKTEEK